MWSKGELYGRFGRRGSLRGILHGGMLSATWLVGTRSGWITARFDAGFGSLEGHYGIDADRTNPLSAWSGATTGELSGAVRLQLAGDVAQSL
jgi:hypothetical protein